MNERRKTRISPRKQPVQARSTELVAVILEAAAQVLAKQGATRFTTARVAEKAGVSIGSLYQYFPNKAAILFRLQYDEWQRTTELLRSLLAESDAPPLQRLRLLVHAFLRSECEEAPMRIALADAAPLYRDAPEARAAREAGDRAFEDFMQQVLPGVPTPARALAGDLITTTLSAVGADFSASPHSEAEIHVQAEALADMFAAYLRSLGAS